jgi:hypothetical protein
MKKLYVEINTKDTLILENIKAEEIQISDKFILFGDVACVSLNNFVSYNFVENKESENKNNE